MNGQLSQGFSIDNTHGSQDPPSLKSQRAAKKKNVSRRGTAFTKEEDLVVCSTFLNISKDPIIESDEQVLWAQRSIDRLNESGKNEQDRIDDVVQMYERTKPFTIMHCWKKLRNEAKWNNKFLELNSCTSPDGMSSPPTQGHTVADHAESGNENIDTSRPEGRDSAKKRRSKSFTETSSSSTAVEVLQRLQEKSEKTKQKQDQQMTEILSRKDEKIKIQRDLFNLQKKHMKVSVQQKKRKMRLERSQRLT
ncbi:unnamed protein product [Miscanthus lutarioriparius]|uniref:No apical meristem-associated C-terminal domain-containing protein n=1 Tax=Miscanthus lutarioriparius TaxID=422564 RepID=A0A811N1K1_9POAL|nr:unnamed protein product [Miscanthus lutarioriparius]